VRLADQIGFNWVKEMQTVRNKWARALVGLADEVRVSVDPLAARNDAARGARNFDQATLALECFYPVGFERR
jgi:hypothetical protein